MSQSCNESLRNELEKKFQQELDTLRADLMAQIPQDKDSNSEAIKGFLSQDKLDDDLAKFAIINEATPKGLAEFAATSNEDQHEEDGKTNQEIVEGLLSDTELMKKMVLADGAKDGKYGQAAKIYSDILRERQHCQEAGDYPVDEAKRKAPVLDRLALAIALEHAVPMEQHNALQDPVTTVDPVQRYLNYEMAFLEGELDRDFVVLDTWNLRFVVDGDEPDEIAVWGRKTCRNFQPDHVVTQNEMWRYVMMVRSDVRYGSGDVKYDRPELQKYQNMLMNGGICGRRAWFGRFILRCFGMPTTARPSKGHGALVRWTNADGWLVVLGPDWGQGWTKTQYKRDLDFRASAQARDFPDDFKKVKRAQFAGDLLGEKRCYGADDGEPGYWYGLSLKVQQELLDEKKPIERDDKASNYGPTLADEYLAAPVSPDAKQITYHNDGNEIRIPAAAFENSSTGAKESAVFKSFKGGCQLYLKPFQPQGLTIMRGGTWKNDANVCCSGYRLLSSGYGHYNNWGFRVALDADQANAKIDADGNYQPEVSIGIRDSDGVTLDMVYIKPGKFIMGHESTEDGRFTCVEVPKHEVEITRGFYMGKYPVTQAQFEAVMGWNPSNSSKGPDYPVDDFSEADARKFCVEFTVNTARSIRLPTEAEWEYACRAGQGDSKWFFGDDPSQLGEYAWIKENSDMKSHPVGQKKPNPFGLYDIYGNVCERINDKYEKDYYANSPAQDPQGPPAGISSKIDFKVNIAHTGEYSLLAEVVTVNYNQHMTVAVNGTADSEVKINCPFTSGDWQYTEPVKLNLNQGENLLSFWRSKPPQYGLALKGFTLQSATSPSTVS